MHTNNNNTELPKPNIEPNKHEGKAKTIFVKSIAFYVLGLTMLFPILVLFQLSLFSIKSPLIFNIVFSIVVLIEYAALVFLAMRLANKKKYKYLEARSAASSHTEMKKIKRVKGIKLRTFIALGVWLVLLGMGAYMEFIYEHDFSQDIYGNDNVTIMLGLYIFIWFIALPFIILYITYGVKLRCKQCKFFYTLKKDHLEIHSEESITVKAINQNRNTSGDVISTSEQHVPGKRVHYRQHYRCKFCEKRHYASYSEEYLV